MTCMITILSLAIVCDLVRGRMNTRVLLGINVGQSGGWGKCLKISTHVDDDDKRNRQACAGGERGASLA